MKSAYKKYAVTALLVWAASAIVLGAAYMFLISSRIAKCEVVRDTLAKKEKEYQTALNARPEQLDKELEDLRNKLGDFVAGREEAANLTFAISRLAQERDIPSPSVTDRDKGTSSTLDNCTHIWKKAVDVKFKSGFPQFFSMLHAIESHRPVMFVEGFSIIPDTQNKAENAVELDISVLAREKQDG